MHSSSGSFLRQLSKKEGNMNNVNGVNDDDDNEEENNGDQLVSRKKVMVVVDRSSHSKHVTMWALTHVADKADSVTLLHVVSRKSSKSSSSSSSSSSRDFVNSLGSLCKAFNHEVEVETVIIQGPKLETVMNQVKKLEISVLILSQKISSPFLNCLSRKKNSNSEEFVEQCIKNAECLAIGVRKQRKGLGGYLISTRWQKNFWLLA